MTPESNELGFGFLTNNSALVNPTVIYSEEKNVMISMILKNASYSLEFWVNDNAEHSFKIMQWSEAKDIVDSSRVPKFITILRDPIERAISAIYMLIWQYKYQGLALEYSNFANLEYGIDPHLMPQSVFVPVVYTEDKPYNKQFDIDHAGLAYHFSRGWPQLLEQADLPKSVSDQNVFFYIKPGISVTEELAEYLGEPALAREWRNARKQFEKDNLHYPRSYISYLETVYQQDYELINSVKFENR